MAARVTPQAWGPPQQHITAIPHPTQTVPSEAVFGTPTSMACPVVWPPQVAEPLPGTQIGAGCIEPDHSMLRLPILSEDALCDHMEGVQGSCPRCGAWMITEFQVLSAVCCGLLIHAQHKCSQCNAVLCETRNHPSMALHDTD